MIRRHAPLAALAALGLLGPLGCEDDPPPAAPAAARPATPAATPGGPASPNARRAPGEPPAPPPMQVDDTKFTETSARDPFRSHARDFLTQVNVGETTRDVKLARYSLDDLRLVAVVVGTDSPYAMVVDPSRAGTILRRGMYVGRQEVVHAMNSRGSDYLVHWRVARINPARLRRGADGQFEEVPAEVVFERQNPLDPTAQVVERAITLATGVAGAQQQQGAPPPAPIGPIPGVGGPTPGYLPPNLGGVGGGSASGAITGTQAAAQRAVGGGGAQQPPAQTTVVVQVPPSQPTLQPAAPSNAPPPVQIYNGNGTTR